MPEFVSLNIEYLFYVIYRFFKDFGGGEGSPGPVSLGGGVSFTGFFVFISLLVSIILFGYIMHLLAETWRYHRELEWKLYNKAQEKRTEEAENPAWESVKRHALAESPSEWKLAILEADKMLDEALKNTEVPGSNLGERLKTFDPMKTHWLQDAWEAHKIRNRIAHEIGYEPSKYDTRRAMSMYERALRDLRIIQ